MLDVTGTVVLTEIVDRPTPEVSKITPGSKDKDKLC